ncbi:PilZ domain-containing protein [Methylocystis parvus]|uniref:PilZ domain-containing protein n=1 Tax=Methylocystis parvus TaxID=134 RepID=A0A6B8M7J6_9HYPH|nr:PilZ domain-containing protein [Methylocystis parvus]QGM98478.1 PilZ domain-containing protein [Methylocystis parvus]WBK01185.1 PilZ domain-containing protein [Methylocystis parvus OBBP]
MSLHPTTESFSGYLPIFTSSERRRFQRVHIDLFGRSVLESKAEHHCRTIDISPGGMRLMSTAMPQIGENVTVYIDALGRFHGRVVRAAPDSFSMTINASPEKREMLADKLTWFANRIALNLSDQRRHERIEPFQKFALLRLDSGVELIVKIRDLSASGVGVDSIFSPPVGERVSIGKTYGKVVRHFEGGFAAEFLTPFPEHAIDETTRL